MTNGYHPGVKIQRARGVNFQCARTTLPSELTLFGLASGTPLLWDEQRAQIGMGSDYGITGLAEHPGLTQQLL